MRISRITAAEVLDSRGKPTAFQQGASGSVISELSIGASIRNTQN